MKSKLKQAIAATVIAATAMTSVTASASSKPADPEDRFRHWNVSANGLINSDVWGVEATANYHLNPYAGAGVGFLFLGALNGNTRTGIMPDGKTTWVVEAGLNSTAALRAELLFTTPQLKLGSDREYGLALRVSPGIDIPIPVNRTVSVGYVPYQSGSHSVNYNDNETNHDGKALYGHCKVTALFTVDRLEVSAGYEWSNFDVYGNVRNISISGQKLISSDRKQINAVVVGLAYKF